MTESEYAWWQRAVIYQVYPRSFRDSNADGVGDLPGITSGLDYLRWLGVDAIWISPIFRSPMKDFGYDISDFTDIEPMFGTMADLDALLAAAHEREIKVVLDFVPNHSSDQHPWFIESRSSRDNPKRDWYIWHDPAPDGGPPNNWMSNFGGPAWTFDDHTGQYYYHAFLPEQPDLNWRNPEVRAAMYDVLRFWLDRGVDGFRVDVVYHLIVDEQLRDNPPNPEWDPERMAPHQRYIQVFNIDQPETQDAIAEMRAVLEEYEPERLLIGEIYLPLHRLVRYYGEAGRGLHLPFNFRLLLEEWTAENIGRVITDYERLLPEHGWPNWVLGNHDRPRVATRVGPDQARVAAMLLLALRGTPTVYYGDEIGMQNVHIPPERVQDPFEKRVPGQGFGRDPQRTPMQWSDEPNAGFTSGDPWLPLAPDWEVQNVERQRDDARSMLTLHRRLMALRREHHALSVGTYGAEPAGEGVLAFRRIGPDEQWLVALNFTDEPRRMEAPAELLCGDLVLSTYLDREERVSGGHLALRPDEGVMVRLDQMPPAGAHEGHVER